MLFGGAGLPRGQAGWFLMTRTGAEPVSTTVLVLPATPEPDPSAAAPYVAIRDHFRAVQVDQIVADAGELHRDPPLADELAEAVEGRGPVRVVVLAPKVRDSVVFHRWKSELYCCHMIFARKNLTLVLVPTTHIGPGCPERCNGGS